MRQTRLACRVRGARTQVADSAITKLSSRAPLRAATRHALPFSTPALRTTGNVDLKLISRCLLNRESRFALPLLLDQPSASQAGQYTGPEHAHDPNDLRRRRSTGWLAVSLATLASALGRFRLRSPRLNGAAWRFAARRFAARRRSSLLRSGRLFLRRSCSITQLRSASCRSDSAIRRSFPSSTATRHSQHQTISVTRHQEVDMPWKRAAHKRLAGHSSERRLERATPSLMCRRHS